METPAEFENIKAAIKGARVRAGLTQEAAAKRAGVTARGWQEWETGDTNPTMRIRDIERALDLEPGYFTAQLSVLGRLMSFEGQLHRIEAAIDDVKELNRDILGALRLANFSDDA